MNNMQFHETPMGRIYYEQTLPKFIKALNRAAAALEEHSQALRVGKAMELLVLPDHLRRTLTALYKLGEGTAEKVSKITGMARSVESKYLNELANRDLLKKGRGKPVVFSLSREFI